MVHPDLDPIAWAACVIHQDRSQVIPAQGHIIIMIIYQILVISVAADSDVDESLLVSLPDESRIMS